jgi:hypothetical protein
MSHDRSTTIPLPLDKPRCEPAGPCTMQSQCARYMASIPQGADLGDMSLAPQGGTALCSGYISTASLRLESSPRPGRKVHPSTGSLA